MVIFDCNGVLVDSEPIAAAVLSEALGRVGVALSAAGAIRRFHGRRPADIFAAVEAATGRRLPSDFSAYCRRGNAATPARGAAADRPCRACLDLDSRAEGRGVVLAARAHPHQPRSHRPDAVLRAALFSASAVRKGKPAPDLFLLAAARSQVAPGECIVVEDSAPGVAAAAAAGMTPIGFVGGSHTPGKLAAELLASGARTIVADLRALKSTIADLRGW